VAAELAAQRGRLRKRRQATMADWLRDKAAPMLGAEIVADGGLATTIG
jgi:hypothetical protein